LNIAWTADAKNLVVVRANTNNDLILVRDTDRNVDRENLTAKKVYMNGRWPFS